MTCQLTQWRGCCCKCEHRLVRIVMTRRGTNRSMRLQGYACVPPTAKTVYTPWPEHGLCEMFRRKK